jgi:S1-C subfamily serine protease
MLSPPTGPLVRKFDEQLRGDLPERVHIEPGDSGGPLVNMRGQVVGMDTAASSTFQFRYGGSENAPAPEAYAIPVNEALALAKQIEYGKAASSIHIGSSAFLGVELASTSAYSGFGSTAFGVPILGVVAGSPAAHAGLAAGDAITALNGHSVKTLSALRDVVDQFHPDQELTVNWVDQYGNSYKSTLKLASGPTG